MYIMRLTVAALFVSRIDCYCYRPSHNVAGEPPRVKWTVTTTTRSHIHICNEDTYIYIYIM